MYSLLPGATSDSFLQSNPRRHTLTGDEPQTLPQIRFSLLRLRPNPLESKVCREFDGVAPLSITKALWFKQLLPQPASSRHAAYKYLRCLLFPEAVPI